MAVLHAYFTILKFLYAHICFKPAIYVYKYSLKVHYLMYSIKTNKPNELVSPKPYFKGHTGSLAAAGKLPGPTEHLRRSAALPPTRRRTWKLNISCIIDSISTYKNRRLELVINIKKYITEWHSLKMQA